MILSYLSPDDVQAIHHTTLRILSEIGVILDEVEALSLLMDHGAYKVNGRLCFPPDLVESCLALCPSEVILAGRGNQVTLGDGFMHVHNLGGARDVLELERGELRPATRRDLAESARLLDALENVSTVTPLYTPQDVPAKAMTLAMFDQTVRNTIKPVNGPGVQTREEVQRLAEAIQILFGESCAVTLAVSPISPLTYPDELLQAILEIARQGIPFVPLPCPNLGATAPMSLAGALAQQNAENLAAIVLAQLVAPGLPVIYSGRLATINMRTLGPAWGNPEIGLAAAATVQIGHLYDLPVNVYGLACNTYGLDIQNGYERALNAVVPALAGADELSGVGEMAGGIFSCPAQMVIDNEIIGMVQRLRRGFQVDDESLALDVITKVMSAGRNFMAESHTVKHLRAGEAWIGTLTMPESNWEAWRENGSRTIVDRALGSVENILKQHEVPPLRAEQTRALDEIMQAVTEDRF
jgi:trimethylamine--corrinoid protein Co-methyltransferase